MDKVRIQLLGGFHVFVNNAAVEEQLLKTRKGCMLLQYLILQRGAPVPSGTLYDALWQEDENTNPANALKTLISRTRVILGKMSPILEKCIATQRGSYRFNPDCGVEVDMYEFEALAQQLGEAKFVSDETETMFRRLMNLYSGDLLPMYTDENWVIPRNVELHNRYVKTVLDYTELLRNAGDYNEVIRVARMALDVDAFDERLHVTLMDALARAGRSNESLMQYKHASNIYYRYLGAQPPEGLKDYYGQIIAAGQELETGIEMIKADLAEAGKVRGAFVCDYAVFKDIYHLQARNLERLGLPMFIVLMKVSGVDGVMPDPLRLDDVMRRLQDVLRDNLRKGDTVSRFSPNQFVLLLPTVNYDTGKMVMERIRRAFYTEQVGSDIMLTYRFGPVDGKSV